MYTHCMYSDLIDEDKPTLKFVAQVILKISQHYKLTEAKLQLVTKANVFALLSFCYVKLFFSWTGRQNLHTTTQMSLKISSFTVK